MDLQLFQYSLIFLFTVFTVYFTHSFRPFARFYFYLFANLKTIKLRFSEFDVMRLTGLIRSVAATETAKKTAQVDFFSKKIKFFTDKLIIFPEYH